MPPPGGGPDDVIARLGDFKAQQVEGGQIAAGLRPTRGLAEQFLPVARDGDHAIGRLVCGVTEDDEHRLGRPEAERHARAAAVFVVCKQRRNAAGLGLPEFRLFARDAERAHRLEALRAAVGDEVQVGLRQAAVDIAQRPAGVEVRRHALLGQPLPGRLAGHDARVGPQRVAELPHLGIALRVIGQARRVLRPRRGNHRGPGLDQFLDLAQERGVMLSTTGNTSTR